MSVHLGGVAGVISVAGHRQRRVCMWVDVRLAHM